MQRKEMQILSREEMQRLLIQAKAEGYYEIFLLELSTGLRQGELLALQWDDLNFTTGELRIDKQLSRTGGVAAPKTKAAVRTIILPPSVLNALKKHRDAVNSKWLFPSNKIEDAPLAASTVRQKLRLILERAGCKQVRFHDLRHPYVKHTTKIFSLRLKGFQAQPVPGALRKTRGAFQHLREGGTRNPVLQSCNKKRSSWSVPQSKMSFILYAISMRLSGYTSTLSMRRSVSSVFSPSKWKTALAASCRLSCRACSSCFCFTCANTAA